MTDKWELMVIGTVLSDTGAMKVAETCDLQILPERE
jgi:hypothetical protein